MSIAAALPINQLTEDQAVEELARILDLAPDEADQLAFVHWKQEFSRRAQQLEQHIVHLQKASGADALLGPEPETQDAPPHHLQPEPAPGPAATKEKKPMGKSPKEKLAVQVDLYAENLAKSKADPTNTQLRKNVQTIRWRIGNMTKEFKLTYPDLEPLPPLPNPLKGPAPKATHSMPPALEGRAKRELEPLTEKAGPGPYVEPTAEQILQAAETHRAALGMPMACGEDCIHPSHHHSSADLDFRDHQPQLARVTIAPGSALREIRKAFWALLRDMEDMAYPERAALSHDLVFIQHQAAHALELIEEETVSEAG